MWIVACKEGVHFLASASHAFHALCGGGCVLVRGGNGANGAVLRVEVPEDGTADLHGVVQSGGVRGGEQVVHVGDVWGLLIEAVNHLAQVWGETGVTQGGRVDHRRRFGRHCAW